MLGGVLYVVGAEGGDEEVGVVVILRSVSTGTLCLS